MFLRQELLLIDNLSDIRNEPRKNRKGIWLLLHVRTMFLVTDTLGVSAMPLKYQQVWYWPYEAPGIVDSGLYDITIVCGPKDMSLEKYFLISQKKI